VISVGPPSGGPGPVDKRTFSPAAAHTRGPAPTGLRDVFPVVHTPYYYDEVF